MKEQINTKIEILLAMNESIHQNISIVHQLKEIFFKIIFCTYTLTSVEVGVVYEPWQLIDRSNKMDVGETQSQFQVQLQIAVVDDVVHFET